MANGDVYTSLGEAFVIDALDAALTTPAIQSGVGTTTPAKGDTALANTTGCPGRQTGGTKSQPAADVLRYVDTIAQTFPPRPSTTGTPVAGRRRRG
jgi:hypothetical protein